MNKVQWNSHGKNYLPDNCYGLEGDRPGLKQIRESTEFDGYFICFIEGLHLRAVGMH